MCCVLGAGWRISLWTAWRTQLVQSLLRGVQERCRATLLASVTGDQQAVRLPARPRPPDSSSAASHRCAGAQGTFFCASLFQPELLSRLFNNASLQIVAGKADALFQSTLFPESSRRPEPPPLISAGMSAHGDAGCSRLINEAHPALCSSF